MLKGSFSLSRLRWLEDVVEMLDLECQKVGFSWVGDGCYRVSEQAPRAYRRGGVVFGNGGKGGKGGKGGREGGDWRCLTGRYTPLSLISADR